MSVVSNIIDFVQIVDENKKNLMTGVLVKDSDGEYKTLVRSAAITNITGKQIAGNFVHVREIEKYGYEVSVVEDYVNPYIQRTVMIKKKEQPKIEVPRMEKKLLTNKEEFSTQKIPINYIVVHWTANENKGAGADNHWHWFNGKKYDSKGNRYRASCHYVTDDKKVLQIMEDNWYGWHASTTYYNSQSIGIEMCVNSDGDFKKTYYNTVYLVALKLKQYKLTVDKVVRHYDSNGKMCPAYFVNDTYAKKYLSFLGIKTAKEGWARFKQDVQDMLNKI